MVGVNRFVEDEPWRWDIHRHAERFEQEHAEALARLRAERDAARVSRALRELRQAARAGSNLVPILVETVKTYAAMGEICDGPREVFGEYQGATVY